MNIETIEDAWNAVEAIREKTDNCVIVEASVRPHEYICAVGWHHRGQWMEDERAVAQTMQDAVAEVAERLL